VQWWLVPRHPQRFDDVAALVASAGHALVRRSQWGPQLPDSPIAGSDAVVLGDSLGEMPFYFGAASVCLLGGSFEPLGGQNLIEAAAFGCPIVMGPHTFNFAEASQQAEEAGAAARVRDLDEALNQVLAWLDAPQALAEARQAGLTLIAQSRGAADRYAQALLNELQPTVL
jgi:3-deoxy-D-manno-octulosonic-acid transferase